MSKAQRSKKVPAAAVHEKPLTDRERITWLLSFLRRDVESLRPGEVLDLRADFGRYLYAAFESDDSVYLADLQQDLLAGLAQRTDPGTWDPFGPGRSAPAYIYYGLGDGNVSVRKPTGDWDTVAYAAAADLVMEWFPQLRRCELEECRANWVTCGHPKMLAEHPPFQPAIFALDVLLPIVSLGQEAAWTPMRKEFTLNLPVLGAILVSRWAGLVVMWLEIGLGWGISLVLVAIVGGVVKRE